MFWFVCLVQLAFAAERFIPASDPSVWSVGRTRQNQDGNGSLSFDWESTQFFINVQGASYVKIHLEATGGISGRFLIHLNGWEVASVWVGGHQSPEPSGTVVVQALGGRKCQIRVISVLEPAFLFASDEPTNFRAPSFLTFQGFSIDGQSLPAGPRRTRRIELIGDSISAGYGSRGYQGAALGCPPTPWTSGNPYTYNWYIAEFFNADLIPIAWSGKGMYVNCCDNGETMPSYYLQTLGSESYTEDWDFSRFTPDMLIINLGTNDFGHDSGPAWEAKFVETYLNFILNATMRYKNPTLPVFVAQGPMNCGNALRKSLNNVIAQANAKGCKTTYLDVCGPPNDGCGGHPGVEGHLQMFEKAHPQIASVMGWNN